MQGKYTVVLVLALLAVSLSIKNRDHLSPKHDGVTDSVASYFPDSWTGDKCDKTCQDKGGKVCGIIKKQCCEDCTLNFCKGKQYLNLTCGETWTDDVCNNACTSRGGAVCGNYLKDCCVDPVCNKGTVSESCGINGPKLGIGCDALKAQVEQQKAAQKKKDCPWWNPFC